MGEEERAFLCRVGRLCCRDDGLLWYWHIIPKNLTSVSRNLLKKSFAGRFLWYQHCFHILQLFPPNENSKLPASNWAPIWCWMKDRSITALLFFTPPSINWCALWKSNLFYRHQIYGKQVSERKHSCTWNSCLPDLEEHRPNAPQLCPAEEPRTAGCISPTARKHGSDPACVGWMFQEKFIK